MSKDTKALKAVPGFVDRLAGPQAEPVFRTVLVRPEGLRVEHVIENVELDRATGKGCYQLATIVLDDYKGTPSDTKQ